MRNHKDIYFTIAPPIFLLIPSTPSTISNTTATPTSTENIKMYLAIAVSIHINIVYK